MMMMMISKLCSLSGFIKPPQTTRDTFEIKDTILLNQTTANSLLADVHRPAGARAAVRHPSCLSVGEFSYQRLLDICKKLSVDTSKCVWRRRRRVYVCSLVWENQLHRTARVSVRSSSERAASVGPTAPPALRLSRLHVTCRRRCAC